MCVSLSVHVCVCARVFVWVSLFVYVCGKQFKNKYKKLAHNVAAMGRMRDREGERLAEAVEQEAFGNREGRMID